MKIDTTKKVDYSRATLRGLDLSEANLINLNLTYANLGETNLREADLRWADLRWADLRGANLKYAKIGNVEWEDAIYNDKTIFPDGFDPEKEGMVYKPSSEKKHLNSPSPSLNSAVRWLVKRINLLTRLFNNKGSQPK